MMRAQESYISLERSVFAGGLAHGGESFTSFCCSIGLAMGTTLSPSVMPAFSKGWASPQIQAEFLGVFPDSVRTGGGGDEWMRIYKAHLANILAVTGDVDPGVRPPAPAPATAATAATTASQPQLSGSPPPPAGAPVSKRTSSTCGACSVL